MGCLCALVSGGLATAVLAAPQAGVATTSWELDFTFHDLQRITLRHPGDAAPTTYWYMLYEVSNNTRRDVEFYPSFTIVTDTLRPVRGGDQIGPSVYDAIHRRHHSEFPFFAPPSKVTGLLLQGKDHARASAAVFRDFDPLANSFTVYISGLTGEVVRVANPALFGAGVNDGSTVPPSFILQRTLAIEYDLPGDPTTRMSAVPIRRSRHWLMR